MSKKNIVIILIITIVLSVMALSVWGKASEDSKRIDATNLIMYDKNNAVIELVDEESVDKEKLIDISANDEDFNKIAYQFSVEIKPEDTTDFDISATIISQNKPELEEVPQQEKSEEEDPDHVSKRTHTYQIIFDYDQRSVTKIEFKFNKGGVSITDYLKFTFTIYHEDIIH